MPSPLDTLSLKRLPFGVVFLAEPGVPLSEMQRDLGNIAQLGFNTVVLYPSVSRWDAPLPGETAFATIDALMDTCAELGLGVVLELQGQVMQDADAPECSGYAQAPDYRENGFHQPQKEALLAKYLREVVTHFKGHPALIAYDLFNEIGNNSRSPETIGAFVAYLRNQYAGDIQNLNRAWVTYFNDFEDITRIPPNFRVWSWSSVVAERDWQRFRSADFVAQVESWRAIVREIDADTPLFIDVLGSDALHNRTGDYYGVSDWDAVEASDVLGLSCYANMLGPRWWETDAWQWPQFWRHARSVAGDKQTMVSELMTANRCIFPTEGSSMTDELGLWSYQAVFHGIQGVIYWKYRPFRRGRQVAGRGLTDFDGTPNAFADQASEVAHFVQENAESLAESQPDTAGCLIVFDPEMERLYSAIGEGEATTPPKPFYTDAHRGWFQAFWQNGYAPGYTTPARMLEDGIPEGTQLIVIPCLPGITEAFAQTLKTFVEDGGTVVSESRFGLLDIDGNLQPQAPGFGLRDVAGVQEVSFSCRGAREIFLPEDSLTLMDDYWQSLKLAEGTEVLIKATDGEPALTRNQFGRGQWLHLPFLLGHKIEKSESPSGAMAYMSALLKHVGPSLQPAVKVVSKGPLADVSVLLRKDGQPWLVGISNFAHERTEVVLALPENITLSDAGDIACEQEGQSVRVMLKPRSCQALHLC
ncbi:beta-galactosidase [Ruficoccus sp. ZRK36]|uniref:beta-galactosidase n=1 Tax=Ruficoccus sp. ZRK36 TaxID=2866311 RepID=UPI001C736F30|nr:beta-galactosidase [Ruficoccus sp. ZRK36]QYY35048.1 beta-galactosidase [Ruficoccus sp. ZRK36]